MAIRTWCAVAGMAAGADERGLWSVWVRHRDAAADPAGVLEACDAFARQAPDDPLGPVVAGIAGWRLLHANRHEAARERFVAMLAGRGPLGLAGAEMARTWLTRLDAVDVHEALRAYYRRHVRFPDSLDALAHETVPAPPLTDRWTRSWVYRTPEFRMIPGLRGQRYELASLSLSTPLDLAAALALPYAGGMALAPVRVADGAPPTVVLQRTNDGVPREHDAPILLTVGGRHERTVLAWLGERLLVLADGDHWQVMPRPAAGGR